MCKKVLCTLLAVTMLLTSTDFTVLAEETQNQVTDEVVEAEGQPSDEAVASGEQTPDGAEEPDSDGYVETEEQPSEDASAENESEASDSEGIQGEAVEETTDESMEIIDENTGTEQEFLEEENTETLTATGETVYADGEIASGECGENLTWKLENGTLTISGTGDMDDYSMIYNGNPDNSITDAPWGEYCRSESSKIALCIEEGVTNIGAYAFFGCRGLSGSLDIPDGVTRIGDEAFYNCMGLSGELVIPGSTGSIGESAFMHCSGFTSLIISEGVTSIGLVAFRGCSNLSGELIIPNSVTSIGQNAFVECINIEKVVISNQVSSIEYMTFDGCTSLKGPLIIPKSVKSIGDAAFRNCVNIKNIYLYDTLSSISIDSGTYSTNSFDGIPKSDIVFHCIKDSYAYKWAQENGYKVVEWDGDAIDMDDVYLDDITVIGRGYAYANFILLNNKGEVQKNKDVTYSFDGENYDLATSDENGYIRLKSPLLVNESNEEETKEIKTTEILLCYDDSDEPEKLNYNVIMDVTVLPLSFTQTWELGMEASITGSIGEQIGINVGVANLDAELAKAEISGTAGGNLSLEHTFENGARNLTLFQNYNTKVAVNADIGPAAEANLIGQNVELDVVTVGAGAAVGASTGIGLKLENYDPENPEQLVKIGGFMLASQAQASGNMMLLELAELAGINYYNLEQFGTTVSVEAGAKVGSVSFAGNDVGALGAADVERIITFDTLIDRDEKSKEIAFGYELGASVGLGELATLNEAILSKSANGKLEIGAELDENNKVQSFSVKKEEREAGGFINKTGTVNTAEISYDGEAIEQIGNNIGVVKDFVTGSTHYIFGDAQTDLFEKLDTTPIKGSYSSTVINQDYIPSLKVGLGAEVVVGLEADVSFEGVYSSEYETAGGTYESGRRFISNENEIEDEVKNNSYTIEQLLAEPLVKGAERMHDFLVDKFGVIGEIIENGWASLEQVFSEGAEGVKNWVLHLVSLKLDGSNAGRLSQSYEVTAYTMEKAVGRAADGDTEINEYKVYTIGDPYCVYVTDESENEVADYSENPLMLTLGYSDEMLAAAGLSGTQAGNIAVYMYSEEVYGYICIGGAVNAEEKTVSVEITKPGQYILAADAVAPVITNIKVSQNTNKPEITVEFNEASGFKEFSLKLDDEEVVGTADWKKYYNKAFQHIFYQVERELAAGRHTVSVYAVDSAGNAMAQPYEIEFYIGNILYSVTFDTDDGTEPMEVKIVEGVPVTLPDAPSRRGYIFMGWYTERNGQGTEFTAQSEITADMTVYAYWLKIVCK